MRDNLFYSYQGACGGRFAAVLGRRNVSKPSESARWRGEESKNPHVGIQGLPSDSSAAEGVVVVDPLTDSSVGQVSTTDLDVRIVEVSTGDGVGSLDTRSPPSLERRRLEVSGRSEPIDVRVSRVGAPSQRPAG